MSHTPGPWFVAHKPSDEGLAVIEDGRHGGLFPIKCEWTEAHLIAAAPDMYEALSNIITGLEQDGDILPRDFRAAKDALTKAKGEQ